MLSPNYYPTNTLTVKKKISPKFRISNFQFSIFHIFTQQHHTHSQPKTKGRGRRGRIYAASEARRGAWSRIRPDRRRGTPKAPQEDRTDVRLPYGYRTPVLPLCRCSRQAVGPERATRTARRSTRAHRAPRRPQQASKPLAGRGGALRRSVAGKKGSLRAAIRSRRRIVRGSSGVLRPRRNCQP